MPMLLDGIFKVRRQTDQTYHLMQLEQICFPSLGLIETKTILKRYMYNSQFIIFNSH